MPTSVLGVNPIVLISKAGDPCNTLQVKAGSLFS